MERIAECTLGATNPNAEPRIVRIAVFKPELDPKCQHGTTYRTIVEFDGLCKPRFIHGEGSLQSLALAFSYLRARLKTSSNEGWVLNYPGTDTIVAPDLNLFGDSWIAPPDADEFWGDDADS